MGDTDTYSMHSFHSFINAQSKNKGGNYFNNETHGKKYKLRLKFDGSCVLEVVRLNGGHFQNLTHLDISGNSAEKLDLRSLNRLEWLCCANNNLEVLMLSGSSLTYLDCSYNNLLSLSVDPVPNNLSTLHASFNNLEELPAWTWMIPELFSIHASHNSLRQLDCKFQNSLSNLPIRELHLHCNKIEFVSKDFIQRATRLKILNLSRNFIEHMPNLGKRSVLQELYLSRNKLLDSEDKDALDFLSEASQIKRLYLGYNKIERINERFTSVWKNLEELILCGNRVRSLPSKLFTLNNLRVLRVHSNLLENAPNLSRMTALKVVDLSHNNLRKINLDNLISGGNLIYLDISCNERLSLDAEKLSSQNQKRPMNLVEVTHSRKFASVRENEAKDFPANPPWELGFSELPDRNLVLSVSQYRDVNVANGKEALFGLFDGGEGNAAPKYISRSIAKIYAEEKNIEETHGFSLKYTLLNAMKSIRQQGYSSALQGILCLLSTHEDNMFPGQASFFLNLALVGGIHCVLVESGKKVRRLTDVTEIGVESPTSNGSGSTKKNGSEDGEVRSNASSSDSHSTENNLNANIPDPKVLSIPLSTSAEFLIIGNQTIWNHVNDAELLEELEEHRHKKTVLIAKRLADIVQSHACKQAISLIVVKFKWHHPSNNSGSKKRIGVGKLVAPPANGGGDLGPLSYYSHSSEYSDPLTSVVTPDSAIDTDRSSSGGGSVGSTKSVSTNVSSTTAHRPISYHPHPIELKESNRQSRRASSSSKSRGDFPPDDEDHESSANTSVSQMSVEQFKCWEYMLEQNTKLLFKKELDTLSKGIFQRNQKRRKSVHFPYGQQQQQQAVSPTNANVSHVPGSTSSRVQSGVHPNARRTSSNGSTTPTAFYSLSKAKSLSHLFGVEPNKVSALPLPQPQPPQLVESTNKGKKPSSSKSKFPSAGFLGSVRNSAKRVIHGGPNAAYFSSAQRQAANGTSIPLSSVSPSTAALFHHDQEIQEVKRFDSIDHDSRLKKYWENKITEL